jgi:hypothetical protein
MRQFTLMILLLLLFFFSCTKKEKIPTNLFLNKISLSSWNKETFDFLKSDICGYKKNSINYIKFISHQGDTIKNIDNQLKFYLKKRDRLLSELFRNKKSLSDYTDTLVISEKYIGTTFPKVRFIIATNNIKNSLILYFKKDTLVKNEKLHSDGYIYEYDSIISSKSKCIINNINMANDVTFETALYLDKDKNMVYELKLCNLSFSVIN